MKITATFFGKTREVKASPYNMMEDEQPEHILWVERSEDYYALSSSELRNKKVAVVERADWLAAE